MNLTFLRSSTAKRMKIHLMTTLTTKKEAVIMKSRKCSKATCMERESGPKRNT